MKRPSKQLLLHYLFVLNIILCFAPGAALAEETLLQQERTTAPTTATETPDAEVTESTVIQDSMNNIEAIQGMLKALRDEINNGKETSSTTRNRMEGLKKSLDLIDRKLKEAYTGLDDTKSGIDSNAKHIDKVSQELVGLSRDIRANAVDMGSQKTLIEDNSIRLYELLLNISDINDRIQAYAKELENSEAVNQKKEIKKAVTADLNRLWMLLSTVLVFFTPLAFVISGTRDEPLSDGTEQHQGMMLACMGVFLGYFVLGFGLMYGESVSGWVGIPTHLLGGITIENGATPSFRFTEFVVYKMGFEMLAALIVYVAVGRKIPSFGHILLALFVGAILIPIYGHWVSSAHYISINNGWLESAGFIDQAGAMTINTVAGWFSLILVWKLGKASPLPISTVKKQDQPVYSSSATILLWLSWMGFTTGTLPISSEQISNVMLNVSLAASAGGTTAFLHYVIFHHQDRSRIARGLGGFVSGLVAIAACAGSVTYAEAALIGSISGLLQNVAYSYLRKSFLKQDWQVRAAYLVAIHGVAGIWGALCLALLGSEGNFNQPNFIQLGVQAQGVAVAVVYSIVMANLVFFFMPKKFKKPVNTTTLETPTATT